MSSTDWTPETGVSLLVVSDRKHGGNSSYRIYVSTGAGNGIKRGSSQQAIVYVWIYTYASYDPLVGHLSYGNQSLTGWSTQSWHYYKVSFWYDSANNVKWSRQEKWVTDAWVQQGTDTNHGSGSPSSNPIRIGNGDLTSDLWVDDIEVYEESV